MADKVPLWISAHVQISKKKYQMPFVQGSFDK